MKISSALLLLMLVLGCYAGSVKPLLEKPEFQAENQPVRTLKVLLATDNTFRREEIEKFVSRSSSLAEMQVGIRLEISEWYVIKWRDERDDVWKMLVRIAEDTWDKRDRFDMAMGFTFFEYRSEPEKLMLGAIDAIFWRYIVVRELDFQVLLHELFHGFLFRHDHSDEWAMRAEKHPYGAEWHWLKPEERKEVLRNKWRDFNVMPAPPGKAGHKATKAEFYSRVGMVHLQRDELNEAFSYFDRALRIDMKLAEAYVGRGNAFFRMGRYDQAISELTKAVEIDPENAVAYGLRGFVYTVQGQYDLAMNDANRANEIDPKCASGYITRAGVYYSKGESSKSRDEVKKAKELGIRIPTDLLDALRKALRQKR